MGSEGSALSCCSMIGHRRPLAKGQQQQHPQFRRHAGSGEKAPLPAFLSETHQVSGKVPVCFHMGPAQALAWKQPARTRLCSESSPTAEWATSELRPAPADRARRTWDPLPLWALCPPRPVSSLCHQQGCASTPGGSPTLSAPCAAPRQPPSLPPAQAHPTATPSGRARGGGKAAILTSAWPSTSLSRLLALNVLHWAREKEGKRVSSDASAAQLEEQCLETELQPERHSRRGGGSAPSPGV